MNVNGILNVLKPPGMTSFDVVKYLKGLLKLGKSGKIGHTGTLDPAAAGVLPICTGHATKAIEYLINHDKLYRAELTLGITTDTLDSTGTVIASKPYIEDTVEIAEALQSFTGKLLQTPPMYSAVKQDGRRLYELARKGITVEREPRLIEIYSIQNVHFMLPRVIFDVACSKGTYIRTLCADIGEKLGCGGCMSFLLRMKSGIFDIDNSLTFEEIDHFNKLGTLAERMTSVDKIFAGFKNIRLSGSETKKILDGVFIDVGTGIYSEGEIISLYNEAGNFFALGEIVLRHGKLCIKSKKLFMI